MCGKLRQQNDVNRSHYGAFTVKFEQILYINPTCFLLTLSVYLSLRISLMAKKNLFKLTSVFSKLILSVILGVLSFR